jgi:hypothetical protein
MVSEAERLPLVKGVKITTIVQLPPADSDVPHVVTSEKSEGSVPVKAMLLMLNLELPVSVTVTV